MLPWIEKYRPADLEQIIIDKDIRVLFDNMVETKLFPNMLFYGPPGTGKTTTIMCLVKKFQEKYGFYNNVIHLNASDERGIEVIRNQLYSFIQTNGLFHNELKFVILDEVDSMTKQAQQSLLSLITKSNVRFFLICNYISKLIPALRDYLLIIPFYNTLDDNDYIQMILEKENITISKEVIDDIKYNYYPDMRSIVNALQAYKSFDYPIISKQMIIHNCNHYNSQLIREYISTNSFKEYLLRLFMNMIYYNIDTKLILMMHSLIKKPEFKYFDRVFMPYFFTINSISIK
jgi:replication factor C subunit 3/5